MCNVGPLLILQLLICQPVAQIDCVGIIFARQATTLASEITGKVEAVHVRIGDVVTERQLLVALESPGLSQELASSRAAVRAAMAEVDKSTAELKEVNRSLDLRRGAVGVFTDEEIEAMKTRQSVLAANLEIAREVVSQQNAIVQQFLEKKKSLEIHAPFSGTVAACYCEPDEFVSTGTELVRLLNTIDVWVRFAVLEEDAEWLGIGKKVRVRTTHGTLDAIAVVRHISPEIDSVIGVIVAEAALEGTSLKRVEVPLGSVVRVQPLMDGTISLPTSTDMLQKSE